MHVCFFFFISECQEHLNDDGAQFILKDFDILFSVIEYIDQINYRELHYIYENILVKSNPINCYLVEFNFID